MKTSPPPYIADTAIVQSLPGSGTKVWNGAHIREDASIGRECIIGDYAYIDKDVSIGDHCKIGNGAQVFSAAKIGRGVFIGPGAMLLNDKHPRAVGKDGELLKEGEWKKQSVYVGAGSSIGAGAIILPGVTIGENAVIGAGSRVTKDVGDGETWIEVGVRGVDLEDSAVMPVPDSMLGSSEEQLVNDLKQAVDEEDWQDVISLATLLEQRNA